jgi:metal-sulfur cluster biosynthetic enzyme
METENEFLQIEDKIIRILRNIYDPEIPVNIYDLGLIYELDVD